MLNLYTPKIEDLWFRKKFMDDPDTMSYNNAWGGTIDFPEDQWQEWYDHWITDPEGKRFYRYVQEKSGEFVGEIAYHLDARRSVTIADVIIYAPFRGRGYGSKALEMLCDSARNNGVKVLYDDIAIDNPAIKMFLNQGFSEDYRTDEYIMLKKEL